MSGGYFSLAEQSLPITRTELTRSRGALDGDIAPLAEPLPVALVDPAVPDAVLDEAPVVPVVPGDAEALSTDPVTSTRLPTLDDRSDEAPSSTYVVPALGCALGMLPVVPAVPAVVPDVELVPVDAVDPPLPLEVAFVKMNDAPALDPEDVRGAVPDVADPPVVPVVFVAVVMSPRCRQPATVIEPPCALAFGMAC